jgi:diaminopropionate ammonia-lyase
MEKGEVIIIFNTPKCAKNLKLLAHFKKSKIIMSEHFINKPNNEIPISLTTKILKNSNALPYHQSLSVYASTPLVSLPNLAKKYGVANIYIKNEAFRFGLNAFKGLGASYAIHKLLEKQSDITTFCTATDGNHGRAVAWAAHLSGKESVVFVPRDTTQNRMIAIEKEGAKVIKIDGNYDETCAFAEEASVKNGWTLVQDTAWEGYEEIPAQIMAGYLTHFQELENSLHILPKPKVDIVFLQAGVGSWAGAAIWYYLNRYGKNRPKIVVVEPYQAAGILASFKADKRVMPNGNFDTIMAGLNCGIPSLSAWEIIKNGTDISLKVKDEYAERAIRELYYPLENDESIIAGESGVGGLAGFMALMTESNAKNIRETLEITEKTSILFYNTEGATDFDSFNRIIKTSVTT